MRGTVPALSRPYSAARSRVTRSDKCCCSVPPSTLSGRHPMTAGGTQTGRELQHRALPHRRVSLEQLKSEAQRPRHLLHITASRTKIQALDGHWTPRGLSWVRRLIPGWCCIALTSCIICTFFPFIPMLDFYFIFDTWIPLLPGEDDQLGVSPDYSLSPFIIVSGTS